jgi:aspartyl-tRNA(Asn)/glutamyl-tRNA(Gln) amidotransferase subunit B
MYQTVVGLEIHIHLNTQTKAFCSCRAEFGDEPNTNVCPVCLGYPGVLPVLNQEALAQGYAVARALECELSKRTFFDRKNYFYPDMPKNYQITQFHDPVGRHGRIEFLAADGTVKSVRIHDVHLEEDAGKMIHAGDMTLCDYNRAGYSLLEVVTEPDLTSGEDAEAFLLSFQRLVRYLGVSDGNMDEGSMKCDTNVSIRKAGEGLGTKVEIKNLNSTRFIKKAIEFEAKRQSVALDGGQRIVQETRLWNENRDVTETMRTKEGSLDYRYFPEPDIPPFVPDATFWDDIQARQVERPLARRQRLAQAFGLSREQADYVSESRFVANFFESTVKAVAQGGGAAGQSVANWLMGDVQKELNHFGLTLDACPLTPDRLAQLQNLLDSGRIHIKIAKQLLDAVFEENKDPEVTMREKGLEAITTEAQLAPIVNQVFAAQASVVAAIQAGDVRQRGFLVGQVMKATDGRAAPALVNEILTKKLQNL